MGIYLNSKRAALLYRKEARAIYFIDKSKMIEEFIGFLGGEEDDSVKACGIMVTILCQE